MITAGRGRQVNRSAARTKRVLRTLSPRGGALQSCAARNTPARCVPPFVGWEWAGGSGAGRTPADKQSAEQTYSCQALRISPGNYLQNYIRSVRVTSRSATAGSVFVRHGCSNVSSNRTFGRPHNSRATSHKLEPQARCASTASPECSRINAWSPRQPRRCRRRSSPTEPSAGGSTCSGRCG